MSKTVEVLITYKVEIDDVDMTDDEIIEWVEQHFYSMGVDLGIGEGMAEYDPEINIYE